MPHYLQVEQGLTSKSLGDFFVLPRSDAKYKKSQIARTATSAVSSCTIIGHIGLELLGLAPDISRGNSVVSAPGVGHMPHNAGAKLLTKRCWKP